LTQKKTHGLNQRKREGFSQKKGMVTQQLLLVSLIFWNLENKLYIIGGWLGAGPLAADDLHILDLEMFKWLPHQTSGE